MRIATIGSTELLPYLSSSETDWDGLVGQAYHVRREMQGAILPGDTDIEIALFTGGPIRWEWRHLQAHSSWTGLNLRSGDLILRAGTNEPIELRASSLSPTPTQSFRLFLSPHLLARAAEDLAGRVVPHFRLVERTGFQDPFLTQIVLALWRDLQENAPASKLFAQCATQLLAHHLLRHYTSSGHVAAAIGSPTHTLTPQQLRRVTAYMREHASQNLTLEVLAHHIGFSPYHFARLFRQATGETPHRFLLRQRIERAQELLATNGLPLAQIATDVGFADQSHFTRVFKQFVGITPRACRRECVS